MILSLILALGVSPTLTGNSSAASVLQETPREPQGSPLAIDGVEIPWAEFANWLVVVQGFNNLDSYVESYLIQREFDAAGLVVSTQEVHQHIVAEVEDRVSRAFDGNRQLWLDELQRLGQDESDFLAERTWEVRRMLVLEKLVQSRRVVSEEQVRLAWEDEYGPGGRQMFVSRILLRVRAGVQATGTTRDESQELGRKAQQETLARAQELFERMQREGEFGRYVPEFSEDIQTRKKGGILPDAVIPEDWPGLDFDALVKLEIGGLLPPFLSSGGYNLFQLDRVEVTPLETVQAQVRTRLEQASADQMEITTLLSSLRESANIELLDEVRRSATTENTRFSRPVAIVDGKPLLRSDFARWLVSSRGQPLARGFAQQRWAQQRAIALGLEPTELMIEQRVQKELDNQIQAFFGGDREKWANDLLKKGRDISATMYQAKLRTHNNLRAEALMLRERVITEEMIRREWEERYGADGRAPDIRFILRNIPDPEPGQLETNEDLAKYIAEQSAEAKSFLAQLGERVADGEDFGALARTYSEDPKTRDLGGRGAGRFELHTWPEGIQEALRALKVGQVSVPLELSNQFFLFELAELVHVPLDSVREELRKELMTRPPSAVEVSAFINESTRSMVVEVLPEMVK